MNRRLRPPFPRALASALLVLLLAAFTSSVSAQTETTPTTTATAAATTATTQASIDPFMALPESDLIIVLDAQRVLRDAVPRILAGDEKTLLQMNTALDSVKVLTGIDARSVRRIVVGLRSLSPNMKKEDFDGVFIVEGIDSEKLLSLVRAGAKGKFSEQQYQGQSVYTFPKSLDPKLSFDLTLAALDTGTLAVGTPSQVRASIDASGGRVPRVSADLAGAATRHPTALVSLAFNVSPAFFDTAKKASDTAGGDSEMISKAFSTLKMFHAAIGMTADGYDLLAAARLETSEQAKSLSDMLGGFKQLALMEPPKNEQEKMFHGLLKNIEISAQDNEVQLKTEVSQASVDSLVKSIKEASIKPTPPTTNLKQTTPTRRSTRRTRRTRRG